MTSRVAQILVVLCLCGCKFWVASAGEQEPLVSVKDSVNEIQVDVKAARCDVGIAFRKNHTADKHGARYLRQSCNLPLREEMRLVSIALTEMQNRYPDYLENLDRILWGRIRGTSFVGRMVSSYLTESSRQYEDKKKPDQLALKALQYPQVFAEVFAVFGAHGIALRVAGADEVDGQVIDLALAQSLGISYDKERAGDWVPTDAIVFFEVVR